MKDKKKEQEDVANFNVPMLPNMVRQLSFNWGRSIDSMENVGLGRVFSTSSFIVHKD